VKLRSSFLRPQNSHDVNPVDYQTWDVVQDRMYQMPVEDVADLRQRFIYAHCKALLTMLLMYGIRDFRSVWIKGQPVEHLL